MALRLCKTVLKLGRPRLNEIRVIQVICLCTNSVHNTAQISSDNVYLSIFICSITNHTAGNRKTAERNGQG